MFSVKSIYISGAHNYRGRHGQEPGTDPTSKVTEVRCVAGKGLEGDRFFGHQDDFKGQVTFFSSEVFQKLCDALNVHDKEPSVLRRNIITEGVDLNTLIGERFEVQGVAFEGSEECAPCYWMNQAFGEGAEEWLKGCGGLRARVVSEGVLKVDA